MSGVPWVHVAGEASTPKELWQEPNGDAAQVRMESLTQGCITKFLATVFGGKDNMDVNSG